MSLERLLHATIRRRLVGRQTAGKPLVGNPTFRFRIEARTTLPSSLPNLGRECAVWRQASPNCAFRTWRSCRSCHFNLGTTRVRPLLSRLCLAALAISRHSSRFTIFPCNSFSARPFAQLSDPKPLVLQHLHLAPPPPPFMVLPLFDLDVLFVLKLATKTTKRKLTRCFCILNTITRY